MGPTDHAAIIPCFLGARIGTVHYDVGCYYNVHSVAPARCGSNSRGYYFLYGDTTFLYHYVT